MGLYEVLLSMYILAMGTILANFHMCGIMLLLRVVLNMLIRNASPRGPICHDPVSCYFCYGVLPPGPELL